MIDGCGVCWSKCDNQIPSNLASDAQGNLLVGGLFGTAIQLDNWSPVAAQSWAAFVAKLDAAGSVVWARTLWSENPADLQVSGIATDANGDVVITGWFEGALDIEQRQLTGGDSGVLQGDAGQDCGAPPNVPQSGAVNAEHFSGAGSCDAFIMKLEGVSGNVLWEHTWGGSACEWGGAVTIDSSGNIITTGTFMGRTIDLGGEPIRGSDQGFSTWYLAKLNGAGAHLWSMALGDANDYYWPLVTADDAGNVLLTGTFKGALAIRDSVLTSLGGWDVFVAKLDSDGGNIWSLRGGDSSDQLATALDVSDDGGIFVGGDFSGTLDLGGRSVVASRVSDIFVVRIGP